MRKNVFQVKIFYLTVIGSFPSSSSRLLMLRGDSPSLSSTNEGAPCASWRLLAPRILALSYLVYSVITLHLKARLLSYVPEVGVSALTFTFLFRWAGVFLQVLNFLQYVL